MAKVKNKQEDIQNKQEAMKNVLFYLIKEQERIKDLEKEIAIYKYDGIIIR